MSWYILHFFEIWNFVKYGLKYALASFLYYWAWNQTQEEYIRSIKIVDSIIDAHKNIEYGT